MKLPADYRSLDWRQRKTVREEYVKIQDGKCSHCGEPLNTSARQDIAKKTVKRSLFPASFFQYPVHLHHCHKTGMTIGAVHNQCNAVLWQYHGE
jgi:hypothetical protein